MTEDQLEYAIRYLKTFCLVSDSDLKKNIQLLLTEYDTILEEKIGIENTMNAEREDK